MAEGRQRGHVDHGAQLGPPALGDRRPSSVLAAFPSRGLQAGQLHQLPAMLVSVERANLGDQPGDGDPPDPRQRGEIRRLVKRLEEGLGLGGNVIELVPDAVDTLHQPGYFPHGGFMPMGRRHRPPGFLSDLLNLEAPHPPSAPVRLHDSYEIGLRQVGNSLRRQASPQHREASRSRDRFPLADQFREDAVELMHQQGLESCALAAKAMVFPPGPPQLHVVGGEELALGDDSRAKQLCDLLRVGEVSLVSTHLPGLAHPKGRQRIDHVIPKCVPLKEGALPGFSWVIG